MFSIDDHTGNVVTTVALFLAAIAVLYLARGAFFILLLSLLFAYLLEPAVTFLEGRSRLRKRRRIWAVVQVYLVLILLLGGVGYEFGPRLAMQLRNFRSALPGILEGFSTGRAAANLENMNRFSAAQQQQIHDFLIRHHDVIVSVFERGAASAGYLVASAAWIFVIPILAIFILLEGPEMADSTIEALGRREKRAPLKRILQQVHVMLGRYIRAQFALGALSFVFYSVAMLLLKFPYAIALGLVGGVLEFLPAVGWIASAALFLTVGVLTHSHWIGLALLLVGWRVVQDYANAPHIMGSKLQLPPLIILFALMVGGQLGGIAGVYLSVPAVAVLRIMWLEYFSNENPESESACSDRQTVGVKS